VVWNNRLSTNNCINIWTIMCTKYLIIINNKLKINIYINICTNTHREWIKIINNIHNWFRTKDLDKLRYFLGIEVAQSKDDIVISQWKYAMNILEETSLLNAKHIDTPIWIQMSSFYLIRGSFHQIQGNIGDWLKIWIIL
jgi:hypothetical protein